MDPFIYAFAVSTALGALTSLSFALLWKSAQKAVVTEKAAHEGTRANLLATQAALTQSELNRSSEEARLEAVIAAQKKELDEVAHSEDPAVQRARLARLSGG